MKWSATIIGEPCSKGNSRQPAQGKRKDGKLFTRFIKSKKALNYTASFRAQLAFLRPRKQLAGDLRITLHIWYASRRPDLKESLICDLLQEYKDRKTGIVTPGVYANDRAIKEKHVYHMGVDKHNPRCEIAIETIDAPGEKK